jgi:hypothetical protein
MPLSDTMPAGVTGSGTRGDDLLGASASIHPAATVH